MPIRLTLPLDLVQCGVRLYARVTEHFPALDPPLVPVRAPSPILKDIAAVMAFALALPAGRRWVLASGRGAESGAGGLRGRRRRDCDPWRKEVVGDDGFRLVRCSLRHRFGGGRPRCGIRQFFHQ